MPTISMVSTRPSDPRGFDTERKRKVHGVKAINLLLMLTLSQLRRKHGHPYHRVRLTKLRST